MIGLIYSVVNAVSIVGSTLALMSDKNQNVTSKDVLKTSVISLIPVVNTIVCVYWVMKNPLKTKNFISDVRSMFNK